MTTSLVKNSGETLSHAERTRRVLRLCINFLYNHIHAQTSKACREKAKASGARPRHEIFWLQMEVNNVDMCVIDWFKLFADPQGRHSWRQVVSNHKSFKNGLYILPGLDKNAFKELEERMREHRSKFVAHLDDDKEYFLPIQTPAAAAVEYLYGYLVEEEIKVRPFTPVGITSRHALTNVLADFRNEAVEIHERAWAGI